MDLDRLLAGAVLPLKPVLVGVPGRLDAGVVAFDDEAAFFFCAAIEDGTKVRDRQ